jgi:cell division septation protein DedD
MRHHHCLSGLLLLLALLPLAACQSGQQRLEAAHQAYDQKDWAKALSEADAARNELKPPEREKAALVAGLSAFNQNNFQVARERFALSETSSESDVAGKSKLMLGHILDQERSYTAAAGKYEQAATLLKGNEASTARALAEAARGNANPVVAQAPTSAQADIPEDTVIAPRTTPARKSPASKPSPSDRAKPAGSKPSTPSAKGGKSGKDESSKKDDASKAAASGKGHTIQCGAYPQESQAKKRAKDLADDAKRAGLPAPKVTRVTGRDGKRLWIVSVGNFPSREAAKKAMAKLKVDHAEVLPALD